MILILHIVLALTGIILATATFLAPNKTKLKFSYGLAASTLATGVYLTILNPTHLASSCITGLIYFGLVGVFIYSAQKKLAKTNI
jgi:uncharacterized membrane protein YciS (DUF1049 family)